jgi:transcriptional regulator with XRE-family HTH domain
MEIRDVVALNLRHLRKAKGLSQEDLADLAGVDRTYVSALERGIYSVTVDVLTRLASALGVDEAELVRRPQSRKPKR